jgi:N-carbamoyl-L-amino-acid hydrolase
MTHMALTIDRIALQADFDALSAITEPDRPWTRRSFSPLFLEGRAFLARRFAGEGLTVRIDAAGNLIGRWQAESDIAPVLMTGSHSDTVPSGGRFDGIAGVLTGLAAIRALRKAGYRPNHTIELVDFLAEEPSEWGLSCIGSRGMAGALGQRELAMIGPGGETLADAIDRMGGNASGIADARRGNIAGFIEVHIEQGPVLEAEAIPVGIVTGIAGIARVRVRLTGTPAHAGTAPMHMRQDAGLAMARFSLAVRDAAKSFEGAGHFTATIGVLSVEPGGANVVPGAAEAIVDIRAEDGMAMQRFLDTLPVLARDACRLEGCQIAAIEVLSRTSPTPCDATLRARIAEAATLCGLGFRPLASGAGHDAAFIARIAPSAMIFTPSREGKSHCPEEWTEPEALALAAEVLLNTLYLCDRDLCDRAENTRGAAHTDETAA